MFIWELTNNDPVALLHDACVLPPKLDLPRAEPVVTHPYVLPPRTGPASADARRCHAPPLGQHGDLDLAAELDVAHAAVTSGILALAAGSLADGEFAEDAGVALLEGLWIGDARVGHVDVDARLALPRRACARPACDCLGGGLVRKLFPT